MTGENPKGRGSAYGRKKAIPHKDVETSPHDENIGISRIHHKNITKFTFLSFLKNATACAFHNIVQKNTKNV